ncbi:hypothetical protein BH24ACI5_BH24ACI5_17350 [soil metagenome]
MARKCLPGRRYQILHGGNCMDVPHALVTVIESTHVAFEGLSHPLRLIRVDPDPLPPLEARGADLTVETLHNGKVSHAHHRFGFHELDDPKHVVSELANAMLAELKREKGRDEVR